MAKITESSAQTGLTAQELGAKFAQEDTAKRAALRLARVVQNGLSLRRDLAYSPRSFDRSILRRVITR